MSKYKIICLILLPVVFYSPQVAHGKLGPKGKCQDKCRTEICKKELGSLISSQCIDCYKTCDGLPRN
jgi:hypothetical protein